MDITDRKILFTLLKNGRATQRQIASEIGISAQALSYRLGKLMDAGIIRRFVLYTNPAVYNMMQGFAAFNSEREYSGSVVMKIRCLEETTLYGFEAGNYNDLRALIAKASTELGEPLMRYIPSLPAVQLNISQADFNIIDLLKKNPRASATDISSDLELPYATVKRRINLLLKHHIIGVITELDLTSGDIVLFSIFSTRPEIVSDSLSTKSVFQISDSNGGVFVCFSENLKYARDTISSVRAIDPRAEAMVLYQYEFYT